MRIATFLLAFTLLLLIDQSRGQTSGDEWDIADSLTLRLLPSTFKSLPGNVVSYLEDEGYTIPQCSCDTLPHNVISGSFKKKEQRDWAVLASKNRISAILVFWAGSTSNIDSVAPLKDKNFLQSIETGKIGFSRYITVAERRSIMEHYERYGGPKPASIDHAGIDDAFAEKGSVVHYYYKGKWLTLTGGD